MQTVGIVGTGVMGRGIAQLAATHGFDVRLFDVRRAAADDACAFVGSMFAKAVEKGRMTPTQGEAAARLSVVDDLASFAGCDMVIEAAAEGLEVKRSVVEGVERAIGPEAIIASNTSSLSINAIAGFAERADRVCGLHFFNPAPLMKVVEVVPAEATRPEVAAACTEFARRLDRTPIAVRDAPGFLVNQVGRAYGMEGAMIAHERVASFATVDAVLRDAAGFRMGPFELMDLTGLDVTLPASEGIFARLYGDDRYRPSPLLAPRRDAGLLGRKADRGFRTDDEGEAASDAMAGSASIPPVWISLRYQRLAQAVGNRLAIAGIQRVPDDRPPDDALIVVTPFGTDVASEVDDQRLDPQRTVGVDALFGLDARRVLARTPALTSDWAAAASAAFGVDGVAYSWIRDSAGLICQRVVAMIVNLGCEAAQTGVASPGDIDTGVTLGLGYPHGPLAWGDMLGPQTILDLLGNLQRVTGDPRYRPSAWLRRRAQLGLPLTAEEPAT